MQNSEITQFGITWYFDKEYTTGQFANGDWWVLGPVTIVKINPPSVSGSRERNGSMINPSPKQGATQGYDNAMRYNSYSSAYNAALNVSSSKPLVVQPHSSLVSSISVSQADTRPQLQGCSVLTVLPGVPPADAFRPPYCGSDKSIRFQAGQLDYGLLHTLKRTSKTPSLAKVERMFERVWLDHIPGWTADYQHPIDNMQHYGRDLTDEMGIGAMMLHVDLTNAEKQKLLIRFVQLGIDLQGIIDDGGKNNWPNNGGIASGRKWPILFAGLVLDDPHMKSIGTQSVAFAEDQQTFYVQETSKGVYNNGHGNYNSTHLGMPEWGIRHATMPNMDNVAWTADYRRCCTANSWNGMVLAARIMNAQTLWNHDALFDYMDRYIPTSRANKDSAYMTAYNPWTLEMWDTYRSQF